MINSKVYRTTARDEILSTVKTIIMERQNKNFNVAEVMKHMKRQEIVYKESTIRTHITSKCCRNSPNHHGTVFNDFEGLGRGLYQLI